MVLTGNIILYSRDGELCKRFGAAPSDTRSPIGNPAMLRAGPPGPGWFSLVVSLLAANHSGGSDGVKASRSEPEGLGLDAVGRRNILAAEGNDIVMIHFSSALNHCALQLCPLRQDTHLEVPPQIDQ